MRQDEPACCCRTVLFKQAHPGKLPNVKQEGLSYVYMSMHATDDCKCKLCMETQLRLGHIINGSAGRYKTPARLVNIMRHSTDMMSQIIVVFHVPFVLASQLQKVAQLTHAPAHTGVNMQHHTHSGDRYAVVLSSMQQHKPASDVHSAHNA